MLNATVWEDVDAFVEMLQEAEEPSDAEARSIVFHIAEKMGVTLEEKPPHPIMSRNLKLAFPDYAEREEFCTNWLEKELLIFGAPEAKKRLMFYVADSRAFFQTLQAGAKRVKMTTNQKVYLKLIAFADEYLELHDAPARVEEVMKLKQSNVSRAFRRLEEEKLIERWGFSPETGKQVWRLKIPVDSLQVEAKKK